MFLLPFPRLGESVARTIAHLSRHYDEDLTVDSIAEITDISASHLAHLFRSEIGMSVRDYLTRVRVSIAQDLLAHTDEKLESMSHPRPRTFGSPGALAAVVIFATVSGDRMRTPL